MKAIYLDKVIADSNNAIKIESDYYFPVDSVNMDYLQKINNEAECELKGDACYYDLVLDGNIVKDAASTFARPAEASEELHNYIVFKKPIEIKS